MTRVETIGGAVTNYDWRVDSHLSWLFWCRMMALAIGSVRPATLFEWYWTESQGGIP